MAWTRVLTCGFEFQAFEECDWSGSDKSAAASTCITSTNPKTGSYSFVQQTNSSDGPGKNTGSVTQLRTGAYWRGATPTGQTTTSWLIKVTNTAGWITGVRLGSDESTVDLVVNNSVKASTTLTTLGLDTGTYHHVALCASADATTGFISFYVDGNQKLTWTGNTSTDFTGVYYMVSDTTNALHFTGFRLDDLYVDTGTGNSDAAPTVISFDPVIEDGAGSSTQWTANTGNNYQAVDEAGAHDSDTTYVSTTSNGQVDLYSFGNVTPPSGYGVVAAILVAMAKNSEAGPAIKMHMKNGGNTVDSSSLTLGTTYAPVSARFTKQADGTTDMDTTAFNAGEYGFKSVI